MRSKHLWGAALAIPVLMTFTGCAPAPAPTAEKAAEVAPAFKPVISVNEAMVDIVDHNSHILWNAGDPKMAPKTDADWHELQHASATIAAAGSILAIGGSAPGDEKWAKEAKWAELNQKMTDAALKVKLAVDSKNLAGVMAGGDDLVMACEACHAEYKLKIPAHVATKEEQPEHFGHLK